MFSRMESEEIQEVELEFIAEGQCSDCGATSKHLVPDLDGNPICPVCKEYNGM